MTSFHATVVRDIHCVIAAVFVTFLFAGCETTGGGGSSGVLTTAIPGVTVRPGNWNNLAVCDLATNASGDFVTFVYCETDVPIPITIDEAVERGIAKTETVAPGTKDQWIWTSDRTKSVKWKLLRGTWRIDRDHNRLVSF